MLGRLDGTEAGLEGMERLQPLVRPGEERQDFFLFPRLMPINPLTHLGWVSGSTHSSGRDGYEKCYRRTEYRSFGGAVSTGVLRE